jgi:cardiolipin synthase A/B
MLDINSGAENHIETMSAPKIPSLRWLRSGQEIFPAMLHAINAARESIRLEIYTYSNGRIGRQFLEALRVAALRGVRVQILVDSAGSWLLPDDFFEPLIAVAIEVRRFNPLHPLRFGVRNHRKLLLCDEAIIFIGGFNISDEYDGDGVMRGWWDLGVRIESSFLAEHLAMSFDELFALADFRRKPLMRLRAFKRKRKPQKEATAELLLNHPGRGASPFQAALYQDLAQAGNVRIMSAYFLPTRRLRHELICAARRGACVQLILAGKTDVPASQLAARSLYRRLSESGIEIYEYQPQVLHAKVILCDGVTYVGSSNLDIRSLNLNYELMLRLDDKIAANLTREIFEHTLKYSQKIEPQQLRKAQTLWQHWKQYWAYFLLSRIDPLVSLQQFHKIEN